MSLVLFDGVGVYLRTGSTCWMSHEDAPVFLSKIIYMMLACHRLLEDRSPGLLEAANVKLDALEFQARLKACASQPVVSNSTVTYPAEQERVTDNAMGAGRDTKVAAEPAKEESDFSSHASNDQATDVDMPSSNDDDLHGRQDGAANAASDCVVEPFAQAGDNDPLPNLVAAADEETESSDGQEEIYQPVRLHATNSRFDDRLRRGPWLHSLPYFVYMHNIKRVRKVKASQASKQASQRFVFDKHYHCPLYTIKKWGPESSRFSLAHNVNNMRTTEGKIMLYGTRPYSD